MPLDLTITPLYRINGQDAANLPGLLALAPPPNAARGRERDRLIVYLLLAGSSTFSTSEYKQVAQDAADMFYQTSGPLTTALRAAAEIVNATLLQRNMTTSSQGQYAVGWLTLAALRDDQCTFSLSGPMHVFLFGQNEVRHIHEPVVSGKGLGANHSANVHYAQIVLSAGNRLLFFGRAPNEWDPALNDATPASLDAMRRRLITSTHADLNAALMQATEGAGVFNLLSGTEEIKKEETSPAPAPAAVLPRREEPAVAPNATPSSAHILQPAEYTAPPQNESHPQVDPLSNLPRTTGTRDFPSSIPRISKPATGELTLPVQESVAEESIQEAPKQEEPTVEKPRTPRRTRRSAARREPSERTRQAARMIATFIQATRRTGETIGGWLRNFIPRFLPNAESSEPLTLSTTMMLFIAILIPLIVVTIASVFYLRYGQSQQYEMYIRQAKEMRNQAMAITDPVGQRKSWENVLLNVDIAESYHKTSEAITLRQEANASLDKLLGITRLSFNPAFSSNLGIDISRMAADDQDLFLLNAEKGDVLRAQPTNNGRGFQLDTSFSCGPGQYGEYKVGHLVDILALPGLNVINATLLGIDAEGNLLYCAPGQVAKAIPLPTPDTNWKHVTAFTMDSGNLYVLDAPARAVWVYTGKDGSFIDRPYFFFGGQTPEKQDVIDLVVSGDDLFMLHSDGHLSTCSYSRLASKPTRCQDPAPLINPSAAYQDIDIFANAHLTQILFTVPPDSSILLLDADKQSLLRLSPRSLELQNQIHPATGTANPIPLGAVGAVAIAPNHVLYMAVNGQIYFAVNMP
jgi:hypothetical protein